MRQRATHTTAQLLPTGAGGWLLAWLRAPWLLRRWPARRVWAKQLLFSGIESVWLVLAVGALSGSILVEQLQRNFGQRGELALHLAVQISCLELAPLLTALILIARSASAIASELASLQVNGELRDLARQGIAAVDYLIMPRIWTLMLSNVGLSVYFLAGSLLAGSLAVGGIDWLFTLNRLLDNFPLSLLLLALLKTALFGLLVGVLACRAGLQQTQDVTDIPKASSRAVIQCLIALFAADVLLVLL